MEITKIKNADLVGLRKFLYFCLVFCLGFMIGKTYYRFISPNDVGYIDGYVQCCYDIEHG